MLAPVYCCLMMCCGGGGGADNVMVTDQETVISWEETWNNYGLHNFLSLPVIAEVSKGRQLDEVAGKCSMYGRAGKCI